MAERHFNIGAESLRDRIDQRGIGQDAMDFVRRDDAHRVYAAGGMAKVDGSEAAGSAGRASRASSCARSRFASASARRARARHLL